jgi:hypothetical protein
MEADPDDSTLYAKRSLCWLHLSEEDKALDDAITYKAMGMDLSNSCYEQAAALILTKVSCGSQWHFVVVFSILCCIFLGDSLMCACLGVCPSMPITHVWIEIGLEKRRSGLKLDLRKNLVTTSFLLVEFPVLGLLLAGCV